MMRLARALVLVGLAGLLPACTTVIEPMRVTTWHYQPVPVYRTHTTVHREIYHFGYQPPIVVHRHHYHYAPRPYLGPQFHVPPWQRY